MGRRGGRVRNNGVNIFCFYSRKKVTCCLPEEGERERERGREREQIRERSRKGKKLERKDAFNQQMCGEIAP